jgi:protein TonB
LDAQTKQKPIRTTSIESSLKEQSMNFTQENPSFSQKLPRLAGVALLHVALFGLLLGGMRVHLPTSAPPPITVTPIPDPTTPQEPPPPPPMPKEVKIKDWVPLPNVVVEHPQLPDTPHITPTAPPKNPPAQPPGTTECVNCGTEIALVTPPPKRAPVVVPAVILASACEKPAYPRNAERNGESGTVKLALLVGSNGRVVDSRVEKSSGVRELDQAARQGLSLCQFKPGTIDGVAQQTWTHMEYAWVLPE